MPFDAAVGGAAPAARNRRLLLCCALAGVVLSLGAAWAVRALRQVLVTAQQEVGVLTASGSGEVGARGDGDAAQPAS